MSHLSSQVPHMTASSAQHTRVAGAAVQSSQNVFMDESRKCGGMCTLCGKVNGAGRQLFGVNNSSLVRNHEPRQLSNLDPSQNGSGQKISDVDVCSVGNKKWKKNDVRKTLGAEQVRCRTNSYL